MLVRPSLPRVVAGPLDAGALEAGPLDADTRPPSRRP